ncbi:hypothetical protein FGIG_12621 [Fasciola gigantica]|uniref:Uncharacterized protein n=1 Tax=Fasciola gigantica TaxID=46835 RepID=A0A504YX33_FASGI|nr:hypothetical protein FGIG_12621 [Fasciola gigantica]
MDSSAMYTTDEIAIQLHVDGLTLYRGSSQQLWPILGRVLKPLSRVFMVGIYCWMTKPADVMKYLDDCVRELKPTHSRHLCLKYIQTFPCSSVWRYI